MELPRGTSPVRNYASVGAMPTVHMPPWISVQRLLAAGSALAVLLGSAPVSSPGIR